MPPIPFLHANLVYGLRVVPVRNNSSTTFKSLDIDDPLASILPALKILANASGFP